MKHKLLTAFAVATSIFVFTENKLPNNNIKAVNYEVYNRGFKKKQANKFFKKWRTVVLKDNCVFEQVENPKTIEALDYTGTDANGVNHQFYPYIALKRGSIIQLKKLKNTWYAKSSSLPASEYYYWTLPTEFNGSDNGYAYGEDGEFSDYNFATLNSYDGNMTIFTKPRKVVVTKNVRADKLRMMTPAYKIYSAQHKTIKKGTTLTVGAPTNHYSHQIWGKGLKTNSKYIWVIDKLSGWYKIIK